MTRADIGKHFLCRHAALGVGLHAVISWSGLITKPPLHRLIALLLSPKPGADNFTCRGIGPGGNFRVDEGCMFGREADRTLIDSGHGIDF